MHPGHEKASDGFRDEEGAPSYHASGDDGESAPLLGPPEVGILLLHRGVHKGTTSPAVYDLPPPSQSRRPFPVFDERQDSPSMWQSDMCAPVDRKQRSIEPPNTRLLEANFIMIDVLTLVGFILTATGILGLPDQVLLWYRCLKQFGMYVYLHHCNMAGGVKHSLGTLMLVHICICRLCKRWYQHGRLPPDTDPAPPTQEELTAARAEVHTAIIRALVAESRSLVLEKDIGDYARCLHELNAKHRETTQQLRGDLQQLERDHYHTIQSIDDKHARTLQRRNERHVRISQSLKDENARALQQVQDEHARSLQRLKHQHARELRRAEDDLLVATTKLGPETRELECEGAKGAARTTIL
ncbi:hypothetical protein MMC34_000740 [Xylographa carneopallida]|nr:hypothetical protein [Xylographa carneopallida]